MNNDDLTDRVAKAIYLEDYQGQPNWTTWELLDDGGKKSYRQMAKTAIAALDEALAEGLQARFQGEP